MTLLPVDGDVPALHEYVAAPPAVRFALKPEQIDVEFTVIFGTGFTVTVATDVPKQPFASVPVTVYEVVAFGAALTVAPVDGVVPAVHKYVAAPVAVSVAVACPSQIATELTATTGFGFIITESVPVPTQPLASETEMLYVPLAPGVAEAIVGFCSEEENEFGPVQFHVAPLVQVKFNELPSHTGELLLIAGMSAVFTTTVVEPVATHPFASVTVTSYCPACAVVAAETEGDDDAEVNEAGPVHE